ncbi:putative transcription factor NAM family [Rosa chinensis]|uniref:Putative transcription factor NAM family n=1 Tax=Rosa chinensis TaxID=74649 RepID=A0A2P6P9V9_ROSCH|nr:NAC domain-containing protein 71 [Rosa chinensis]XP_040367028.1 NAC domain-containing protein 71 [Rosa chinensis]PRQ18721.1 putative transcription factor NAM family [Rosa chinensis]
MGGASLPPGFRFHPTDEELVGYYLSRKLEGLEFELEVIPVIDLYKFDPWELPEKSFLPRRDMEWFFFCPRDRKYPNGSRTNRATKAGYWKATGKDRKVVCQSSVTGYRKTLVFYRGRAPLGDRTEWIMHEYRLNDDFAQGSPGHQGVFALCRVVKKKEHTQKANDSNGEPKAKTTGSTSSNGDLTSTRNSNETLSISAGMSSQVNYQHDESRHSSHTTSPYEVSPMAEFEPAPRGTNPADFWISPDLILDSSKDYPQLQGAVANYFPQYEFPSTMSPWQSYEHTEISPSSSYSNFGDFQMAEDMNQMASMSPFSGHTDYMGYCGNEGLQFEGFDQTSTVRYPNHF